MQRRWWEAPISSLGISHQRSLLVKTNRNTFTEGSCALAGALKALSYYIIYREKEGLIPSQSTFHILVVPNAHFNWFVLVWFSVTGTYIVVLSCSVWFGWLMILSEHFTEWREGSLQCCVIGQWLKKTNNSR